MTAFEWIAIVGAGAWLPHIGLWLYRFFLKPTLRLKVGPAEVGYSSLGPVLAFDCAFSVHKKDAVIDIMEAIITHSKGQQIHLRWKTLFEIFSQVTTQSGDTAEYSKQSPALLLKVGTKSSIALRISFQNPEIERAKTKLANALVDEDNRLRKVAGYTPENTVESKPFNDLLNLYDNQFPWQEGHYDVSIKTTLYGLKNPTTTELTFALTEDDIEQLKSNLRTIEASMTDILVEPDPNKRPTRSWKWANPQLVERT